MKASKNNFLVRLLLIIFVLQLAACNTVSGIGKDMRGAGNVISDTADDVKKKIDND